jgi:hypothetical protein
MNIIARCILMLKSLMRSSLDNYVLPGTVTGTDILWIYMIQWKRDLFIFCVALVYLFTFQENVTSVNEVIHPSPERSQEPTFD